MQTSNKYTPMIVGAVAITAIIGVGGYVFSSSKTNTTITGTAPTNSLQTATTGQTTVTPTPSIAAQSTTTTSYKNGTYSATQIYSVPHGARNSIKVTVTVTDGSISDVTANNDYSDQESGYYIDSFDQNIKSAMVGTKISDAYAGRVGGASLTSSAFNDALQTIINEAKV